MQLNIYQVHKVSVGSLGSLLLFPKMEEGLFDENEIEWVN
jgi:hypothetical protein